MPKLKQPFDCVLAGEIYPTTLEAGTDCPADLVDAATELGLIESAEEEAARIKAEEEAARIKAEEEAKKAADKK